MGRVARVMLLDVCARHRALRDEFATICVEAGLSVELEKGPDNLQLENVLIDGVADFSLDLDFSVMHPLQPSNDLARCALEKWHAKRCTRSPCACVCLSAPVSSLCPLVVEATGTGWGC